MISKTPFKNLEPQRLRGLMWLFFIAMAVPTLVLVYKSYDQLKWEAFYQHRQLAEDLSSRLNSKFSDFIEREENRSFGDYNFITVEGNDVSNFLERSELAQYPIPNNQHSIVGYFQIDAQGNFSSPLLPSSSNLANRYGLSKLEIAQRTQLKSQIETILSSNQLITTPVLASSSLDDLSFELEPSSLESVASNNLPSLSNTSDVVSSSALNQSGFDKLSELRDSAPVKERKSASSDVSVKLEALELEAPYKQKIDQRKESSKAAATLAKTNYQKEQPKRSKRIIVERELSEVVEEEPIAIDSEIDTFESSQIELDQTIVDQVLDTMPLEVTATNTVAAAISVPQQSLQQTIKIFESEVDPFEVSLLDSGHLLLYRKVWRDGQRYIQGLLLNSEQFFNSLSQELYSNSLLAPVSTLTLVHQGELLATFDSKTNSYVRDSSNLSRAQQFNDTLLYKTKLPEPFTQIESVFTIKNLPAGPGAKVILWAAFVLLSVLSVGVFLLYRMSLKNLALVKQQQNFVSSVSHELKTPLTSIRMYGEILQQGWADEEKKKSYYHYIFDESERLTRLINNVLQLSKMTHNEAYVDLKSVSVAELIDIIRSKIDSQVSNANFRLNIEAGEAVSSLKLNIDPDAFTQVIINLVDNAIKFSKASENKSIDISATLQSNNKVCFAVRDYGPGIAKDQLKKIFELFYRTEDELTRETTGTGIGLALVKQLTQLMGGEIDAVNRVPGAEFQLLFKQD